MTMDSPQDAAPAPKPARDIGVADFRLLFQLPLFLDSRDAKVAPGWIATTRERERAKLMKSGLWTEVTDPPRYPDGTGFGAFVYFHDFVQQFLFPRKDDRGAFTLYQRTDLKHLSAMFFVAPKIPQARHDFAIDRLSLHLFEIGVAILTLELRWTGQDSGDALTLADTQRITDHLRRSYTSFFTEDGFAARVPTGVTLNEEPPTYSPDMAKTVLPAFATGDVRDPRVFGHWTRMMAPLTLLADGGPWRDPSDERFPVNSYVRLVCEDEASDAAVRDALRVVSDGDWFRIADAEEPGENAYPYNPDFIRTQAPHIFYDRFFPHPEAGNYATRYAFGGQHFAAVGAGKFFRETISEHWRHHYALLSLIARFEMTVLLMISSQISNTVAVTDRLRRTESQGGPANASAEYFEAGILDIQRRFLKFVHRFRFTGVSSQTQGAEMYARWRDSLRLDAVYTDVREELASATSLVMSDQQTAEARAATNLARVATLGVVGGLIVGVMGANLFVGQGGAMDALAWSEPRQFGVISAMVLAGSGVVARLALKEGRDGFSRFLGLWLFGLAAVAAVFAALSG